MFVGHEASPPKATPAKFVPGKVTHEIGCGPDILNRAEAAIEEGKDPEPGDLKPGIGHNLADEEKVGAKT